jgi:hypothetical protein
MPVSIEKGIQNMIKYSVILTIKKEARGEHSRATYGETFENFDSAADFADQEIARHGIEKARIERSNNGRLIGLTIYPDNPADVFTL